MSPAVPKRNPIPAPALAAATMLLLTASTPPSTTTPPPTQASGTKPAATATTHPTTHGASTSATHTAKPAANPKPAQIPPVEQAGAARTYEDAGAYTLAAQELRALRSRVPPDADLEIALGLDEARSGKLEEAWTRFHEPVLEAALADTNPETRRHDAPWDREKTWINGTFEGWPWYIVRARAELGAATGRWHEAHEAARACVAARALAGKEWFILAVTAARDGALDESRDAVREALVLDPTVPEAHYLAGLFAWKANRRIEAQDHFRDAIGLDSTYRAPALALVRCRLGFAQPDTLPGQLLTGVREAGLVTSPARPKLEEFVQMDSPAIIRRRVFGAIPDSVRSKVPTAQLTLPILVDEYGRIALHELPWFPPSRVPTEAVSAMISALPSWEFTPALKNGARQRVWTAIAISLQGNP